MAYKPMSECWRAACERTVKLPRGARIMAALSLAAADWTLSGSEETNRPFADLMGQAEEQRTQLIEFHAELLNLDGNYDIAAQVAIDGLAADFRKELDQVKGLE
jgi:hypothetical protein